MADGYEPACDLVVTCPGCRAGRYGREREQEAGPLRTGVWMTDETIAIAGDHAGLVMRSALAEQLNDMGFKVQNLGTDSSDSVDYPDYADKLADALKSGPARRGILVCGTGIGISIAANRYRHIRAALCHNTTDARLSRQHNDANVLVVGARTIGAEVAADCLTTFLATEFEGGRHARRVSKMS